MLLKGDVNRHFLFFKLSSKTDEYCNLVLHSWHVHCYCHDCYSPWESSIKLLWIGAWIFRTFSKKFAETETLSIRRYIVDDVLVTSNQNVIRNFLIFCFHLILAYRSALQNSYHLLSNLLYIGTKHSKN